MTSGSFSTFGSLCSRRTSPPAFSKPGNQCTSASMEMRSRHSLANPSECFSKHQEIRSGEYEAHKKHITTITNASDKRVHAYYYYFKMSDFDTLQAMLLQERTHYRVEATSTATDVSNRSKIRNWFVQICTFCQFNDIASLVDIAMNCLDRFVLTPQGSFCCHDQREYQRAAVSCLYTAIKVHAAEALSAQNMATISRGTYTVQQIEEMEYQILTALHWRVNPPTTFCFVREYVQILIASKGQLSDRDQECLEAVLVLIEKQIQAASQDNRLIGLPSSTIALAAVMNAATASDVGKALSVPLSIMDDLVAQSNGGTDALSPHHIQLTTAQDRLYPSLRMMDAIPPKSLPKQRCHGELSPRSSVFLTTNSSLLLNQL